MAHNNQDQGNDGLFDERNRSELDAVGMYSSFLEQGVEILIEMSKVTKSPFLQKKANFFKEQFDRLEDITVINNAVFESASDIPELMRMVNPKEYQKVLSREKARHNVNNFLDKV